MGALLFIGAWVLLGLVVFFIAVSGAPRGARERLYGQTRGARRTITLAITAVFLVMGVAVPALVIAGNERVDEAGRARVRLTAAQERGRELFGRSCNQCHQLAAANTVGTLGPDLDKLKPPRRLVLDAIVNGRLRGQGRMPAQLLRGRDARDVADFVAAVAGRQ